MQDSIAQGDAYLPLITWSRTPPADAVWFSDHHRGTPVAFPMDVIQTSSRGTACRLDPLEAGGRTVGAGRPPLRTPPHPWLADAGRARERRHALAWVGSARTLRLRSSPPPLGGAPSSGACGPDRTGARHRHLPGHADVPLRLGRRGAHALAGIPRLARRWSGW